MRLIYLAFLLNAIAYWALLGRDLGWHQSAWQSVVPSLRRSWVLRQVGLAPAAPLEGPGLTGRDIAAQDGFSSDTMRAAAASMLGLRTPGLGARQQFEILAGSAFALVHFALSVFADITLRDSFDDVQTLASARYKLKGA